MAFFRHLHSRFICMSHVTYIEASCHTYEWVMSRIWMIHVTHMNASCHTCIRDSKILWMSRIAHEIRIMWMSHVDSKHMHGSNPIIKWRFESYKLDLNLTCVIQKSCHTLIHMRECAFMHMSCHALMHKSALSCHTLLHTRECTLTCVDHAEVVSQSDAYECISRVSCHTCGWVKSHS